MSRPRTIAGGLTAVIVAVAPLPPALAPIPDQTIAEGAALSLSASATAPAGGPLVYRLSSAPPGMTIDAATGRIAWTPGYSQAGTYPRVAVEVSDGARAASAAFRVVVRDVNRPPALVAIADQAIPEDAVLALVPRASDPDGDWLTWSGLHLPDGATVDPASGAFSWTPTRAQAGAYRGVVLVASDGKGGRASVTFAIRVTEMCTRAAAIVPESPLPLLDRRQLSGPPVRVAFALVGDRPPIVSTAAAVRLTRGAVSVQADPSAPIVSDGRSVTAAFARRDLAALVSDVPGGGAGELVLSVAAGGAAYTASAVLPVADGALDAGLVATPTVGSGRVSVTYTMPRPGRAEIAVCDAAGRRVRTLVSTDAVRGRFTIEWDGRTDGGHPAPAGRYYLRGLLARVPVTMGIVRVPA